MPKDAVWLALILSLDALWVELVTSHDKRALTAPCTHRTHISMGACVYGFVGASACACMCVCVCVRSASHVREAAATTTT